MPTLIVIGLGIVGLTVAWMVVAAARRGAYSRADLSVFTWGWCGGFALILGTLAVLGIQGQLP